MRENDINTTPTVFGGNIDSDRTVLSSTVKVEPSHTIAVNEIIDSRFHVLSVILYNEHFQPDYAKLEVFKNSNSPYLAEIISYGIHKERFYEAYRYYKNGNVLKRIKETPYSEEFVEKIAIPSINEALHFLHEQGIVHADVKPENILISDDGQALILSDYMHFILIHQIRIRLAKITNFYIGTSYPLLRVLIKCQHGCSYQISIFINEVQVIHQNSIFNAYFFIGQSASFHCLVLKQLYRILLQISHRQLRQRNTIPCSSLRF